MSSITHLISNDVHHVKGFNRFHQFFLIVEEIDGGVNATNQRFANFDEVKIKLPEIIEDLEFFGEWSLSLIQFPQETIDAISLKRELPEKGIKIFELSYMNFGSNSKVFLSNRLIHFYSEDLEGEEDWDQVDPTINFEISDINITVLLQEEIHEHRFLVEEYPGNVDLIYKKYYQIP